MGITFTSFAIRGIDVSQFNGIIDWSKVNCNFAAIRVGYGRSTDSKFLLNWLGAKGKVNRIPYWYMDYYSNHNAESAVYGVSDAEWGKRQADTCWNAIKEDPSAIVFLDIESGNASYAPPIGTVSSRAQAIARAFLERIDALSGKTNGIYCSLGLLTWFTSWFKNRPLWVAWYNESQTIQTVLAAVAKAGWTGKCLIWQYASDGDMNNDGYADGLAMGMQYKFLDLNGWMGTSADYKAFVGGTIIPMSTVQLYRIKILIYNLLVRTGPGTIYPSLRRADFPGEYGVYEEKNGYGRINPTKNEWVSLNTQYVQRLGTTPVVPVLYRVKVLIYNLSVRSGPGILYTFLRRANYPGTYDIYQEKNGYGKISATKSEWISLNAQYVQKLVTAKGLEEMDMLMKLWAAHPELHPDTGEL